MEWLKLPSQILATLFYCKLLDLAALTKAAPYQGRSAPIVSALRLAFEHLLAAQNVRLAFRVAVALSPQEVKAQALSSLINQSQGSGVVKAKAQIELANILTSPAQQLQRKELYDLAQASIGSWHAHAAIDIAVERWAAELNTSTSELILNIEQARLTYQELEYINGLRNLIHKHLDKASLVHDHALEERLERELESLSVQSGFVFLWAISHMNLIHRFNLWSGNDDIVWTAASTAYLQMVMYELPFQKGQCAFILCEVAMRRGDVESALEYSLKCQSEWSQCSTLSQSMSDTLRGRAELLLLKTSFNDTFEELRDRLTGWADRDLKESLLGEAISKLEILLDFFFTCPHLDAAARRNSILSLIGRIEDILKDYPGSDKEKKLGNLSQQKATFLVSEGSKRTDCECELQAVQLLQQALEWYSKEVRDRPTFQTATTKQQIGLLWHSCFTKQRTLDPSLALQCLNTAMNIFASCVEDFTTIGQAVQVTESQYWVALTNYEAGISGIISVEDVLKALTAAERGFDERRNEISVTTGLRAVQAKQFLAKDKHVRDIYRFAFQLCILITRDEVSAWEWVQKAKARSLSDTLGLGAIVPANVRESVTRDEKAFSMFQKEQRLIDDLQHSAPAEKFSKTIELRKFRNEMREQPSLRPLFELREGVALSAKMLKEACADPATGLTSHSFLFVDWYIKTDEIHIMLYPCDGTPKRRFLGISASTVQTWVNNNLHTKEGRIRSIHRDESHPSQPLRALDALIEPLADFSHEGQILVLSPSGPLEAIPLHALRLPAWAPSFNIKRPTLIERNPIVYCANVTAFVQCCRAAWAKEAPQSFTSSVFSIYEPFEDAIFEEGEQLRAYQAADKLASRLQCAPTIGQRATVAKLCHDWPQSDLIYFHGHCDPSPDTITDQSLILAADESVTSDDGLQLKTHANYNVRDSFNLKLKSPHISLMACGSASQMISPGDEPLGIVTALLCAGAASIIGTMWPVASASARTFAELFHSELLDMRQGQQSNFVHKKDDGADVFNLAIALQRAVMKMKRHREARLPYHWAPFVLHGSCFMRRPKGWSGVAE